MRLTYKYRLYPTSAQERTLTQTLAICRWVYNVLLAAKRDAWEKQRLSLSKYDLINSLPALKETHPEWKTIHSQVLQNIPDRITKAFNGFFRRVKEGETPGYPRFKVYGRYRSFTFPQYGNGVSFEQTGRRDGYLTVSKIGRIYFKYHRPISGDIKTVTICKNTLDEWWVCFAVECQSIEIDPPKVSEVGIDVGLLSFATMSDGSSIGNPRFFRSEEDNLAKVQRKQSFAYIHAQENNQIKHNKTNGTHKYTGYLNRRRRATRKTHKRISNKRRNFIHQETCKIVYYFGAIYVEALQVENMVKNRYLSKSISDAAWGLFRKALAYKAERAGRQFRAVDPRKTSQWCSNCGVVVKKTLATRTHDCTVCGLVMDRDHNAALNILALGRQCP